MSLYTISASAKLPSLPQPAGLKIEQSTNAELLASLGGTTTEEVKMRLANDNLAFVAYIEDQPAAFGWMAQGKARIGELNHEFVLPAGNRYLWNFRTGEAFRGLGIYPCLLQYIIRHERHTASRFWIIHAPENKASLKGIVKSGFQYVGTLYTNTGGATTLKNIKGTTPLFNLLEAMHFNISEERPATCWNCSSPYLKKRVSSCCCAATGSVCTRNHLLSLAS